jgi:hypothetical protein
MLLVALGKDEVILSKLELGSLYFLCAATNHDCPQSALDHVVFWYDHPQFGVLKRAWLHVSVLSII